MDTTPQELAVRYILPAIRKELANIFIKKHKLSQKETAEILGITEAAVSQYKHSKRANEITFSDAIIKEIEKSSEIMLKGRENRHAYVEQLVKISNLPQVKKLACCIHKEQCKEFKNCNICFDSTLVSIRS